MCTRSRRRKVWAREGWDETCTRTCAELSGQSSREAAASVAVVRRPNPSHLHVVRRPSVRRSFVGTATESTHYLTSSRFQLSVTKHVL